MTQGWDLPRCGSPAQVGEAPVELLVQVLGVPALADLGVCNGYFESVMHWDHFSYRSRQAVVPPAPGCGSRWLDPRPGWRQTWSSTRSSEWSGVAVAVKLKAEIL